MIRRGEMRFPSGQKKGNLNSPWEKDKPTWFVEMMSKLNYFSRNLYKNTPTCPSWRKHCFHSPLSLSAANSGTLINPLLILLVHFCLALVLLANSIWKHWNWLPQQTTRNSFQAQIWVELISESVIHYSSALVSKPFWWDPSKLETYSNQVSNLHLRGGLSSTALFWRRLDESLSGSIRKCSLIWICGYISGSRMVLSQFVPQAGWRDLKKITLTWKGGRCSWDDPGPLCCRRLEVGIGRTALEGRACGRSSDNLSVCLKLKCWLCFQMG